MFQRFLDSINRFRESSAVASLKSENSRLKLQITDLQLDIRLKDEELKINELAMTQLRAVIERDLERVQAESAVATFSAARLGAPRHDDSPR
jgi:uncharacterized protein involved in exopolysaccharide biosynthesis